MDKRPLMEDVLRENAELRQTVEQQQRQLAEVLDQQRVTAEILNVMTRSPADLLAVLDAVSEGAARLCDAPYAGIQQREGDRLRILASFGSLPTEESRTPWRDPPGTGTLATRGTASGRALLERRSIHTHDMARAVQTDFPDSRESQRRFGYRTTLGVPLLHEGTAIGVITLMRFEVQPFAERQIALVETFASTAALALVNARLIDQLQQARGELRAILDSTSEAIMMVGPDLTFHSMNRQVDELFGVVSKAFVGRPFSDSFALMDQIFVNADAYRARLAGTAMDESTQFTVRVKQQWPARRDLELVSNPVRSENGEFLGRIYAYRDVTLEARLDEQRRQLEAERARAAEVQADLLPGTAPRLPGVQLAGRCIPATQVGGDFFDWHMAAGLVWLTLGDVMGKGMPAALLMATVRATLRAGISGRSPAAALNLAQAALGEDLGRRDSYVTLLHAVYEPATGRLTYADAGHGYALVRRADGSIEKLTRRSFPLGMPFAASFEEGQLTLAPGDALILYSDGLVDAVPDADIVAIADRVDGAATADEMVVRLIGMAVGSNLPASTMLPDDLTVVVLRAEQVSAVVGPPA